MSARSMIRLRDLGEWSGGNTPSKANPDYWTNGTVPWVSPKDMKVDEIASSEDRVSEIALTDGRVSLVPEGSVLLVTRSGILAHTLPIAVTKLPVTINQDLKALTPKTGVLPKYVAHAMRSASRRILDECSKHGTTVASIETNKLLDFEIPLVDFDEQRRIVAEIEKQFSHLDEAVADLKRVKAGLMRYKAAVLKAAVDGRLGRVGAENSPGEGTDSWQPIGLAINSLGQGWSPQCESEASENDDEWAVMKTTAVQPMMFLATENKRLPRGLVPRDHLELTRGDLLITRAGPRSRVGVSCLVKTTRARVLLCDKAYRVRPSLEVAAPEYLEIVLNSPTILDSLDELKTGISDSGLNLTQKRFLELLVPLPSLAEQARIVSDVDRCFSLVRKVEVEIDSSMKRAHALRRAALAHYFSNQG